MCIALGLAHLKESKAGPPNVLLPRHTSQCREDYPCACVASKNCTGGKGCFSLSQACNGVNDCGDWSDEQNCCAPWEYPCACYKNHSCFSLNFCYAKVFKCNSWKNCDDWSDEEGCTCPADTFQCACYSTLNCSELLGCVGQTAVCDGINSCGDWSDEENCSIPSGMFPCRCYVEKNCKSSVLGGINKGWIPRGFVCDNIVQCPDKSDEANCSCNAPMQECGCRKTGTCDSTSTGCISVDQLCDVRRDCQDGSDELNCTVCPLKNQSRCQCDSGRCYRDCVWTSSLCDGMNDCGDWSDEFNCRCSDRHFPCASCHFPCASCVDECRVGSLECLARERVCDGARDCANGNDETGCNCSSGSYTVQCGCIFNEFDCSNSTDRCIPVDWVADGVRDCPDESDEPCTTNELWCISCPVQINTCASSNFNLSKYKKVKCNNFLACDEDLTSCTTTKSVCTSLLCENQSPKCLDTFTCQDGSLISNQFFCDRSPEFYRTCPDFSDEKVSGLGFKCTGISRVRKCVLPQANLYDSVAQCDDGSDLCFVDGTFKCFRCLDRKLIISNNQVCDGVVDCYDLSDECLCNNQTTCNLIYNESRTICPAKQLLCHQNRTCSDLDKVMCNFGVNCTGNANQRYCTQPHSTRELVQTLICGNVQATVCDQRPECELLVDECECSYLPPFCLDPCVIEYVQYLKNPDSVQKVVLENISFAICDGLLNTPNSYVIFSNLYGMNCTQFDENHCPKRFRCPSKRHISIDQRKVCNGAIDCDDGSDEARSLCNRTRFYCNKPDPVSINLHFRCDGIKDCQDGSDEAEELCTHRFYCFSGRVLSIPKNLVENGIDDCSDGSDECAQIFSNRYEMISIPFFRIMYWVMGFIALIGNAIVFVYSLNRVLTETDAGVVSQCTLWFVINLSSADFLMGVYLIGVISQGVVYSGEYCRFDKVWRTGLRCTCFGVVFLISVVASHVALFAMTTFRLVSICKPLYVRNLSARLVVIPTFAATWLLAFAVALIPLYNFPSGYFTSQVWFPNQFYKSDMISKKKIITLADRITGGGNTSYSYFQALDLLVQVFLYNPVKGFVGWYGETSVCMPRILGRSKREASEFAMFLRSASLFIFFYILIAYCFIYKRSKKMADNRARNRRLQARITRLIIVDFLCWIPVCVLGYISSTGYRLSPLAYVACGGLLLPINSAINPLIYSTAINRHISKGFNMFKCK